MIAARQTRRHAFSLMEIIIVVAIFVLVMAIGVPLIWNMLDDAKATAAADTIRGKAAYARARAMETGRAWRFAYMAGTGFYMLAPDDAPDWDGADQSQSFTDQLIRDQLSTDIVIAVSPNDIQGATQQQPTGGGWQTIAVYVYDGSARNDTTTYFGKVGTAPMAIQVRGLTGSVTIRSAKEVMDNLP
jgi:prepilin-type N-terminal cleavage/methylation domain-containing protein